MTTTKDPILMAALDMIRRTGALEVQLRWSDDVEPQVWMVTARFNIGPDNFPRPATEDGKERWDVAGGMNPRQAAFRLCEQLIDGSRCTHCDRPSGIVTTFDGMPLDEVFCWYAYDPELETFRRGCEGTVE